MTPDVGSDHEGIPYRVRSRHFLLFHHHHHQLVKTALRVISELILGSIQERENPKNQLSQEQLGTKSNAQKPPKNAKIGNQRILQKTAWNAQTGNIFGSFAQIRTRILAGLSRECVSAIFRFSPSVAIIELKTTKNPFKLT